MLGVELCAKRAPVVTVMAISAAPGRDPVSALEVGPPTPQRPGHSGRGLCLSGDLSLCVYDLARQTQPPSKDPAEILIWRKRCGGRRPKEKVCLLLVLGSNVLRHSLASHSALEGKL